MGLGVEVLLRFRRDLAVDVSRCSCWWSELVLRYILRQLWLFDSARFELVEGQQSYER